MTHSLKQANPSILSAKLCDYEWLTSAEGQAWLEIARPLAADPLALVSRLRAALTPEQARLIAAQTELQHRAQRKFTASNRMLFTRLGLEQATGETIARYKAQRFAGFHSTADLCCGIGGDLIGLAGCTVAAGYDRDRLTSYVCQYNLRSLGYDAAVNCEEASHVNVLGFDAWHIDPDRRASGRRTIDPCHYAPNLEQIEKLIHGNPNAAVKLAPASVFNSHLDWPFELQWLGHGRECQQQVAWFGCLAKEPGMRTATVLDECGQELGQVVGKGTEPLDVAPLGSYLIEPHAAVIAAGLVGAFASQSNLHLLDRRVGYLTSDEPRRIAWAGCFEVILAIPFDERNLRAELKARNLAPKEIKKRYVQTDPQQLAKRLGNTGDIPCTLILTPLADQIVALVTKRCS